MNKWIKFDKNDQSTWPLTTKGVDYHNPLSIFIVKKYQETLITIGSLDIFEYKYHLETEDKGYEIDNILYWMPLSQLPENL